MFEFREIVFGTVLFLIFISMFVGHG